MPAHFLITDEKVYLQPQAKPVEIAGVQLYKIKEVIDHAQFTDGTAAVGTYQMKEAIPIGATVLFSAIKNITGFAGDTSAVIIIGDGSDTDRYNTGTPSVFATQLDGVASGVASGVKYHATTIRPTITITTASDWTSVSAGEVTIEIVYMK
jgi:hypothetical protein